MNVCVVDCARVHVFVHTLYIRAPSRPFLDLST